MSYSQIIGALGQTEWQVTTGLTRLLAVICEENIGGSYTIYDSATKNASDRLVMATVVPTNCTELLFKRLTLRNGLYISLASIIIVTVIYE